LTLGEQNHKQKITENLLSTKLSALHIILRKEQGTEKQWRDALVRQN